MVPNPGHVRHLVPASEVSKRVRALQRRLEAAGAALAWLDHPTDRFYFTGSMQNGAVLLPASGDPLFLVRKSLSRAEAEASVPVRKHPGRRGLPDVLRDMAASGRVAVAMDVTSATTFVSLREMLEGHEPLDIARDVRELRAVKSAWEIEQIRGAAAQMNTLLGEIRPRIRPGMAELELAGIAEGRLRELGHGGTVRVRRPGADIAISTTVGGTSGLYPSAFDGPVGGPGPYPSSPSGGGVAKLEPGKSVMLDIVTSYNGYHADTTRSFFLGQDPPREAREAHEFCRDTLRRIEERLRPGERCSAIYRDVLRAGEEIGEPEGFMGYAENRVRFFGHGVGLELDELPVLADRVDVDLVPGMVVAVEPKAFLGDIGPVGVENTYVVTDGAPESLCPIDDALVLL